MKPLPLLLSFLFAGLITWGQQPAIDSMRWLLEKEKVDSNRALLLCQISQAYQKSKPDSALLNAQEAYFISKNRFIHGESLALSEMAEAFNNLGNFPQALKYYIEELKLEETRGYPDNMAAVYLHLALLYDNSKDFDHALLYAQKADSIITANQFEELSLYSLLDIGEIFEKKNLLDSALLYTKGCYTKSIQAKNDLISGTALNNLGNILTKTGNYPEAFKNYRAALPFLESSGDFNTYAESLLGMARIFEKGQNLDSAAAYAKKSYVLAAQNQFEVKALDASVLLAQLYKKQGRLDSSYTYLEVMTSLKDSVESKEKIKGLQSLTMEEELRQQEMAKLKLDEQKDRREKLQLLLVGILIPICFLGSVFLSRKKVNKRVIEFSGIISILLLFEYITLLLHPFIAEKTNHSPFIEIVIFVAIAAVITPAHHRIQAWLIGKLIQFNYLKHHQPERPEKENVNPEEPLS